MGLISFTLVQDGTSPQASQVNNPLNTIYNEFNGGISSANLATGAVTTAKLADASVTNAKLATGAGEPGGSYTTFTPSWTNLTVGSGTNQGRYKRIGNFVHVRTRFVMGAGSAMGTNPTLTLPIAASSEQYTATTAVGELACLDTSAPGAFYGVVRWGSTTTATPRLYAVSGLNISLASVTNVVPMTWATGDELVFDFIYEAA